MIWYLNGDPLTKSQQCAVPLGIQGENETLVYTADVSDWLAAWPLGVIALVLQPPDGSDVYMGNTSLDRETGVLSWTVTEFDTAIVGYGKGELRIVSGDVVKKSWTFATYTRASVLAAASVPPEPVPDWISDLMQTIDGIPDLIQQAEDAANAAETSAQEAAIILDSLDVATVAETKSYLNMA